MAHQSALSLRPARGADRQTVTHLLAEAYLSVTSFAETTWNRLSTPFLTLLASDTRSRNWGTIVLQVESHTADEPGRVYVRGLAVARGRNSREDVTNLLVHTQHYLHAQHTSAQLILLTDRPWLHRAANRSGLSQVDTLRYLQRNLDLPNGSSPGGLVRPAEDADYNALARRDAELFGPLWHMEASALRAQARSGCLFVQQMDTALAGFILFAWPQACGGPAFVTRLAVWPEWQGHQIGSYLLMCAAARLRREQTDRVGLNVLDSNTPGRHFYTRHGFRPQGRPQAVLTGRIGCTPAMR